MAKSLQDQLLKAGLISDAKAKTVKTEKRKQAKQQQKNNLQVADEAKLQLQQAKAEQIERDRLLNQQKQREAEQKALIAQIKQLIDDNKQAQDPNGEAYNFTDGNAVKKIYINDSMRQAISKGRAAIVKIEKHYEVVAAEVAEKIQQRDASYVLVLNALKDEAGVSADDPYAAYQIPDDLIW